MLEASIGASSPYPLTRTPGPSDVTMRLTGSVQAAGAGGLLTASLQATRPPIEGETPETTRALAVRTAMEPAALRAALDDAVRRLVPWERKGG